MKRMRCCLLLSSLLSSPVRLLVRRQLALWLALVLLPVTCLPAAAGASGTEEVSSAGAADQREADLMDLWSEGPEGRIWVTAALQMADGMLLTSPALLPENQSGLLVSDGVNEWKVQAVIPDSTGITAMVFFDPGGLVPVSCGWPVMPFGDSAQASSCVVRSGNAPGERRSSGILGASSLRWQGRRALLLDLAEDVPMGGAVVNSRGELAGIVVARYAEGSRRVLALPVEEIVQTVSEIGSLLDNLSGWGNPAEGFRVSADRNALTVDWSAMVLPEKAEGEELYVVVADTANDYLNYYPAETSNRVLRLILTPGRVYLSGVMASAGPPASLPEYYELTVIPPAEKLTAHDFQPILTAVALLPEGVAEGQAPEPVEQVTEEILRSDRAYFYSASVYLVTEALPEESLLVTLTAPDGNNYRYESLWVYAPEYMNEDVWYISLQDSGLTSALNRDGYPRGEYQMAFYVNGALADAFTFELK